MHGCLKQEQEIMEKKKKGLQKNKMMSIAKQDWDGESQNTLGIWTLKTN